MLPTVAIGPWHLSTSVLVHAVAFALAGLLAYHRLVRGGFPRTWVMQGIELAILSGLVGAVLFPDLLALLAGRLFSGLERGSTIFGAIAGGAVSSFAYCRWRRVPVWQALDRGVVAVPLGQAIGRLGCLASGCCWGKPADSWLAMDLPGAGGLWQLRYPTQLLSAAGNLLIFVLLLAFERWRRRAAKPPEWPISGFLAFLYLELYFSKRFLIEFLRDDPPYVAGPFTWAHLLAVIGLGGIAVWLFLRLRGRQAGPETAHG